MRRFSARAMSVLLVLAMTVRAAAEDAGASAAGDAGAPPTAERPDARIREVRALLAGELDVSISPQSLFEVPLHDDAAIEVEAARLRTLLRAAEEAARPPPATARARSKSSVASEPDAGSLRAELASLDPALWSQRLQLDRARLEFYSLAAEQRSELLRAHAARQEAARPRVSASERRAQEATAERDRVLAAAREARSEAERLVAEELARLIALESSVRAVRDRLRERRAEIAERRDAVLGWQRRVRDAKATGSAVADATYDALRRALRTFRDELASALDALGDERSEVPASGPDPLLDFPPEVPAEAARARRSELERAIAAARREELALREDRAAALMEAINAMNLERLRLLPHLSTDKRDAITGFTAAGWDQARSEGRHLALVLRYHQHVAQTWLRTLRSDGARAVSPLRMAGVLVPLLVLLVAFVWGRRKSPVLLETIEARLSIADRAERRTSPSPARRFVRLLLRTHRPLEWLLVLVTSLWLLPAGARELLEVQLLTAVVGWIIVGALVVNVTNALVARSATGFIPMKDDSAGELRLRSLRLVGRTIVMFGLILVLSARLVGKGTIHSWVLSTCWLAAVPVFLILVRWWRGAVLDRLERVRKKTPLQAWILANRSGWKSFLAAVIGALQLFGAGMLKLVGRWLSGFDLARRIHAYLFKREIERIGGEQGRPELTSLPDPALYALHPEQPALRWIGCPGDAVLGRLLQRVAEGRGGLAALVGARGMGKTALLHRMRAQIGAGAALIPCSAQMSLGDLRATIGLGEGTRAGDAPRARLVLLDDAQTLIRPSIGGLETFDALIALARGYSEDFTWVFAFDASLWQLLKRARDARPTFDETHHLAPWTEGQIGDLLAERCARAQIAPTYDALLDKLPPGADEIDRQDALRAKRAGYERMLWDHVGGNPALALEVFRTALATDPSGVVHVRPLQVPEVAKLEKLPDSSLFILRAVLQMAPTTADAVAQATRLRRDEVLQDLRFGKTHGFFEEQAEGVRVAWRWLRPVTRVLERRHLLVRS